MTAWFKAPDFLLDLEYYVVIYKMVFFIPD